MKDIKDEMLSMFGLSNEHSLLDILDDFKDEEEIKEYCWLVLKAYPDLKRADWLIGIERGDFIYSFDGNHVFITDDIWNFNLVAKQPVLELLATQMRSLK